MIKNINKKLNESMNEKKYIYVLKGFGSIVSQLTIEHTHIFDTKINENLKNILSININSMMMEEINYLSKEETYWCLYEEILFIEKKDLYGIIKNSEYNICILDIGCFDYYYPGIISESTKECENIFEKESFESNILQQIYSDFEIRNGVPIIAYNKLDNENDGMYKNLFQKYSEFYDNRRLEKVEAIELYDNSNSEIFIQIFNDVFNKKYNTIRYIKIEGKDEIYIKKFLYILNLIGINIEEEALEHKYNLPENYSEYLEIFHRDSSNVNFDFRDIDMYKDPFKNNEIHKVNQSIIIDTIYNNILKAQNGESFKDIFVTAPTGAGKSILFQIPAIMAAEKQGLLTIVISPLIALMKDQIENIKPLTNAAVTINSEYTPFEKEEIKKNVMNGTKSILYISPEALLSNTDITTFIGDRKIGLLVIDEAHTVSTWGKNFRPDYWYLGDYLNNLRNKSKQLFPIATFTATATISNGIDDMYHDIVESLNLTCVQFFGNVKRKDIIFDIRTHIADHDTKGEKEQIVFNRINEYLDKSDEKTLVYFPYVKHADNFYDMIKKDNLGRYNAKLDKIEKDATIEDFRNGEKNVIFATKAFGMGVNIKDIKNVYHFAPTGNLADYVQEIGRAARKEGMVGVASTDFYQADFSYINKLFGMSQITNYNIIGVLQKILYKYQTLGKRNFLISSDEFAYVFDIYKDEEIESKLKATIIAIKRDFKAMSNFVPVVFKPRGMYTKGLFFISDEDMYRVRKYGWNKYLSIKFDREKLKKMTSSNVEISYTGDVYIFDFKRCWEENYNDNYDGITFGNFKRKFFCNSLENVDTNIFKERSILKISSKYGRNLGDSAYKCIKWLDAVKETFDEIKMQNKHKTPEEISEILYKYGMETNKTKVKNMTEPLMNLLKAYNYNISNGQYKFCDYNSKTNKYNINSSYYNRIISRIKDKIEKIVKGYENELERILVVNTSKSTDRQMRNDADLIAAQIMELFDVSSYSFDRDNSVEFFVRVNSDTAIKKVLDSKEYRSKTLETIARLHYDSVRYMGYFFTVLKTDEERWNFIENYFLGKVDEVYNIPHNKIKSAKYDKIVERQLEEETYNRENIKSIKLYKVFMEDLDESETFYISNEDIEELKNIGYKKLKPETELAEKMKKLSPGDSFIINKEFNYLIESIDVYEMSKNEE